MSLTSSSSLSFARRSVNEQNLNLALRDDSPAYSLAGFQPIPFDRIGPAD